MTLPGVRERGSSDIVVHAARIAVRTKSATALAIFGEGVPDPFEMRSIVWPRHRYNVKSAGRQPRLPQLSQVVSRRREQAPAFRPRDRLGGTAEPVVAAESHLD